MSECQNCVRTSPEMSEYWRQNSEEHVLYDTGAGLERYKRYCSLESKQFIKLTILTQNSLYA